MLVNEASKSGVDVATLDLLLAILAEENHSINSKDEVYRLMSYLI